MAQPMESFTALVAWPSAPLTDRLVRASLASIDPQPTIVTSLVPEERHRNLLQWSSYDAIDHDLTHLSDADYRVLSSSYTIRKALIRKHFLSRCIHNYLTKHPESLLKHAAPRTWELEISYADELDEMWSDDLYDLGEELDKQSDKWWILKPGMADRGMGIRLFHTKEQLQHIFEGFEPESDEEDEEGGEERQGADTAVVTSQLRHFVIQEYLSSPILIDPAEAPLSDLPKPPPSVLRGHKFHLRVYAVASGALTVYMCERILALFSAAPYAPPAADKEADEVNADLAAHLTNTSLQTKRGEAGVRSLDELAGCHVVPSSGSTTDFGKRPVRRGNPRRPPRAMGQVPDPEQLQAERAEERRAEESESDLPVLTKEDIEGIKDQIADVLAETFKAALEMSVHFQPLRNAFELYGIDFLVTHDTATNARKFNVHLLEVNSEPAIELTGPRLTWILEDLFKAIGKTCVAPFFSEDNTCDQGKGGQWNVGESRDALRMCLDVQVRGERGW